MSASYHVDLGNTALFVPSISTGVPPLSASSGVAGSLGLSGATVGQWVDLSNSDSFCNVYVAVGACSGPISIAIQTAPGPNDAIQVGVTNAFSGNIFSGGAPQSGSFTDPTSGLAQLPTWINSGGILLVNSGLYTTPGILGASGQQVGGYTQGTLPFGTNPIQHGQGGTGFVASGSAPEFASGGLAIAGFQRNYQYARLVWLSGASTTPFLQAGFIAQLMTTGSGGGASQLPATQNFTVNV